MSEQFIVDDAGRSREAVVTANALTKQFGDLYAVSDLNFTVPRGRIFGLIGPSGCGKTTTVRLLTGIYHPTSGEALVLGVQPQKFSAKLRERIGYMPQLFVLYPDLSVWENLNFMASLYGMGIFGRSRKLNEYLEFVELSDSKYKKVKNISGGMQRRLSLASTLIHQPELIFLDEPTAGIDPILRRKFWDHFQDLQKQGISLILTTQYVGEAAYCDYVGVMAEGRLLMVETPEGLRRRAFGGDMIDIQTKTYVSWEKIHQIEKFPFVRSVSVMPNNTLRIIVDDASTALPDILEWFKEQNIDVESSNQYLPPFDDVFVTVVQKEMQNV